MEINIQNLDPLNAAIGSYLRRTPNATLSGMFKYFRKQKTIDSFGDWPLMKRIANVRHERTNKTFIPNQIRYAFKFSEEINSLEESTKKTLIKSLRML
jgi:hypothetical protein